jgi:hypothetical protein
MAQRTSTLDLCYYAIAGNGWQRSASANELARRGSNCQAEMPVVNARLRNDQARRQAAAADQAAYQQQQQANTQALTDALRRQSTGAYQPAAPAPAATASAYWTGRQEMSQSVTGAAGWKCEYSYGGQVFWRMFRTSCPSSIAVE